MKNIKYIIIFILSLPFFCNSQDLLIRGKVFSLNQKKPIVGATVQLEGTNLFVLTDSLGYFNIYSYRNTTGQRFIISHVGFTTKSFDIVFDKIAIYYLEENITEVDEVIISTGYQNIPKERATGSFVSVDSELFNRSLSSDVLSRLENVSSSVLFDRRNSGEPTISIRGQSTILSSASPLIVVDNFPYEGSINNINPDDVEYITILKDAAASSIWGARAGNGVIVITTKSGRLNTPLKISLNNNFTLESKPDLFYNPNFLKSSEFIEVEKNLFSKGFYDWMETAITSPLMSPVVELLIKHRKGSIADNDLQRELDKLKSYDVRQDFSKYLFRSGLNQQYVLSTTGGTDHIQFYVSGGVNRHSLSQVGFDKRRVTLNNSLTYYWTKRIQMGTSINYANSLNTHPNTSYGTISSQIYPYAQLLNDDGSSAIVAKDFNNFWKEAAVQKGLMDWYYRPMDDLNAIEFKSRTNDLRMNNHIKYNVYKGFALEGRYQYQHEIISNDNLYKEESYFVRDLINRYAQEGANSQYSFPIPNGGILDYGNSSIVSHSGRLQLDVDQSWDNHKLNFITGMEVRQMKNTGNNARVYGYDPELINSQIVDYKTSFMTMPLRSSLRIPYSFSFSNLLDRNVSYYANAAYSYKSLYTLSGSIRKDQSNLFGVNSNQQGVPLWSIGASWLISSEPWFSYDRWLSFLKLRSTLGYSGNINKSLTAYATARYVRDNLTGLQRANLATPANADLRWEKMQIWNVGLDFGFNNMGLSGSVEYYEKKGMDLIGQSPLDPTLGFIIGNRSRFTGNNANMQASGIDVQITFNKNLNRGFKWNANVLYNYNKDKITQFQYDNTVASLLTSYPTPRVGYPRFSVFSYRWAGLDKQGDPQVYLPDGQVSKEYASLVNYQDMDILGYHGAALPTQFGSFRNTVSYKSFSVGVNMVYKFDYFFRRNSIRYAGLYNSWIGHEDFNKRWINPGDEMLTSVQAEPSNVSSAGVRDNIYLNSSHLVEKADHVRFQDINIGYSFSIGTKTKYLNTLSVNTYLNNIGIIWRANKHKLDPDFVFHNYPAQRTYTIGIILK